MATDEAIRVRPLTRHIGAEIEGLDLARTLTNRQAAEVRQAILDHQVIFFRDQAGLDHDSQKAFGRLFGELAIHSGVAGIEGHPEIVAIHADARSKFVAGEDWHSDLTADACPPMGSILYLHTLPQTGGDTLFASMSAAYDALSDRIKAYLDGLVATHDADHVYRPLFPNVDRKYPCNDHPVVRTHPETGCKSLFVNRSYVIRIKGVSEPESRNILNYLYEHCANPNFQVRFRWSPHAVAFWDNRCTQHLATWDYFPDTRSGFRVTVAGDRPF